MPASSKHRFLPLLAAVAAAGAGHAQTYENDTGGTVTFYGQFSPTLLYVDDGAETTSVLADNANSNSRLGFNLDQEAANGNRFRFTFEAAIGFPQTSDFDQGDEEPFWEWQVTDLRKAEVRYRGEFGEVYLGQGSMATDGAAGADLSGTGIAGTVAMPDTAGGFAFRNSDTEAVEPVTIDDVFTDFDGSRRFRLRYDTREIAGFSGAVAYGTNELSEGDEDVYYDVAVYYGDTLGEVEIEGGLGYAWRERDASGETTENWVGSLALLHSPTGLNGAVAFGGDPDQGRYGYVKLGYRADILTIGASNVSVDYYSGQDVELDGDESTAWGVQFVQRWDAASLEMYVSYRNHALEDDFPADYDDISATLAGLRWRF